MKECITCKAIKPLDDFHNNKNRKDGKNPVCKPCAIAKTKQWQKDNPLKFAVQQFRAGYSRYNMTWLDYSKMEVEQQGKCKSCGDIPPEGKRLVIDHDHSCCPGPASCGKCVRYLLCSNCNTALGLLKEDPDRIQALLDYARLVK